MEAKKHYLLENTPEAAAQVANIIQLFNTAETANIKLALQLLANGGAPNQIWPYLIALLWTGDFDEEDKTTIEGLIIIYASQEFSDQVWAIYDNEYPRHGYNFTYLFENVVFPQGLDKQELANQILLLGAYGEKETIVKYCLVHQTLAPTKILEIFLDGEYMDLSDLNLDFLPKEIGKFHQITYLNLVHNNLKDIPDEIRQLENLNDIGGLDSVSEVILAKLKNYFPKIIARFLCDRANYSSDYEKALRHINESLALDTTSAQAWMTKGSILQNLKKPEESVECFRQATRVEPQNMTAWSNFSLALRKLQRDEESLEVALQGLQAFQQYPNLHQYNKAKLIFRKGQALFFLNRFEEAEAAYDETLRINPNYDSALYNKACIYAKRQQKSIMLEFLQQIIDRNKRFVGIAREDTDFEEYWDDEDFKALLAAAE